jgi:hypothetical protein
VPANLRRRPLAVLGIAVAIASCAGPITGPTVQLNEEFTLAPAEAARIADAALVLRFVSVEGDSRCPADAVCIQGGDARVRIEAFQAGGSPQPYDLHTGDMKPVRHRNFTIALVQLAPYPFTSRTIQQGEYRATFRVTD